MEIIVFVVVFLITCLLSIGTTLLLRSRKADIDAGHATADPQTPLIIFGILFIYPIGAAMVVCENLGIDSETPAADHLSYAFFGLYVLVIIIIPTLLRIFLDFDIYVFIADKIEEITGKLKGPAE